MPKIYENNLIMKAKPRYCRCCGEVLQTRTTERIVKNGDPDRKKYRMTAGLLDTVLFKEVRVVGPEYYCKACGKEFSLEEQKEIVDAQRKMRKKIVSEEEIWPIRVDNMIRQRLYTYLWFPLIGTFLCYKHGFEGSARRKRFMLVLLCSAFLAALVALALINWGEILYDIVVLDEIEKTVFTLLLPGWSFNIPTAVYVACKKRFTVKKSG